MNRILGVCAAAALLATATTAAAQGTGSEAGHEGVYGRVDVGANYMSYSPSGSDVSIGGVGTAFGLTAGYAVMRNLVLHGEFSYQMALSPGLIGAPEGAKAAPGQSMNFLSVGPGATYFLDNGISLSGAAVYASVSAGSDSVDSSAIGGFGFRLGAGKDIWLSEQFALNAGADFFYAGVSKEEKGVKAEGNPMSFGLRIGGSYN